MDAQWQDALRALEAHRRSRVVAYVAGAAPAKFIDPTDEVALYECLRRMGRVPKLDLLLQSGGGFVNAARRFAVLLRRYGTELNILVPHQARSAATLLCLAADHLVLGPLAQLSPIDPQVSGGDGQSGTDSVASEDLRSFRAMARDWFGLDEGASSGAQLLGLLTQRFLPTALAAFYRSDREVRALAEQLLCYWQADAAQRARIADTLVAGYHSHHYGITADEAETLGLPVIRADAAEEALMWDLLLATQAQLSGFGEEGPPCVAVIASDGALARCELGVPSFPESGPLPPAQGPVFVGGPIWRIHA